MTSADCIGSLRRWGARDSFGQHLFARVTDTAAVDDKTFRISLREPYPMMLEALGKIGTSAPYIMRKRDAETDPGQQVRETVGSGPFTYNRDMSQPGARYIYDRNPNYRPRPEPPSFSFWRQGREDRPRHMAQHARRDDCPWRTAQWRDRFL